MLNRKTKTRGEKQTKNQKEYNKIVELNPGYQYLC